MFSLVLSSSTTARSGELQTSLVFLEIRLLEFIALVSRILKRPKYFCHIQLFARTYLVS